MWGTLEQYISEEWEPERVSVNFINTFCLKCNLSDMECFSFLLLFICLKCLPCMVCWPNMTVRSLNPNINPESFGFHELTENLGTIKSLWES